LEEEEEEMEKGASKSANERGGYLSMLVVFPVCGAATKNGNGAWKLQTQRLFSNQKSGLLDGNLVVFKRGTISMKIAI
jgi:hypothetical protein